MTRHLLVIGSVCFLLALSVRLESQATAQRPAVAPTPPAAVQASYVGSSRCGDCHARDLRALVEDADGQRRHRSESRIPRSIIPDFSKPDPLLTFTRDDVAFVYGSKWKQRYFKKVGDDYFPLPAQWDVHAPDLASVLRRSRTPTGGCRSIRPTT